MILKGESVHKPSKLQEKQTDLLKKVKKQLAQGGVELITRDV